MGRTFLWRENGLGLMVTCLAQIVGRVVDIIADNPMYNAGAPDVPATEKETEFICLCDTYNPAINGTRH